MAKDHFVPRHYLRQFEAGKDSEEVAVTQISPYRFLGVKGIGGQSQELDFYENNEALNELLWTTENDLAPVLKKVGQNAKLTEPEVVAMKWLAVMLQLRTRKAAKQYKVFPTHIFANVIQNAIDNGALPPPPYGKPIKEIVDWKGVPGFLIKNAISCSLEMQTLASKLLKAPDGVFLSLVIIPWQFSTNFSRTWNPIAAMRDLVNRVFNYFCQSVQSCAFYFTMQKFTKSGLLDTS